MMKKVKWALIGVAALPLILTALFLQYYLPSTAKVQITGTEVKRMDTSDRDGMPHRSRDVRFIITRDLETQRTRVFRNEDTRWGWPPYFKFNSGDLDGDVQNIRETQKDATVLVTYYGWRITVLDMYPNAVDVEIVDPDYTHFPLFNITFLTVLLGGTGYLYFRIWRWRRRRREKKAEALAEEAQGAGEPGTDPSGAQASGGSESGTSESGATANEGDGEAAASNAEAAETSSTSGSTGS